MEQRNDKNDSGKPDQQLGLYEKYHVERLNDQTGKHRDCTYYVLDLSHDKYAVDALLAYAAACEAEFPTLAFDLRHEAAATARRLNVKRATSAAPDIQCPVCGWVCHEGTTPSAREESKK